MRVVLEPAGGEVLSCEYASDGGDVVVSIGTGPECDLVLPRPRYADLGRVELRLGLVGGQLRVQHLQPLNECRLDGRPAEGVLAPGRHELVVNAHVFLLLVEP